MTGHMPEPRPARDLLDILTLTAVCTTLVALTLHFA